MRDLQPLTNAIHMQTAGGGEPTLLFVHGFCCDGSDWSPLIQRLSDRYRCVAVDLPGHGRSAADTATMTAAGAAVNVAKARSGSQHVVLVGHSLGTKIVREAYRQSSEGVVGMVLVDGSLYVSDRQTMLNNAYAAVAGGMDAFRSALFGRMFSDGDPLEERDRLINRALGVDREFARALFLDSIEWDTRHARETIDQLGIPTMVIQATTFDSQFRWQPLQADGTTPLIDVMRAAVADFEAVIVPGAGHFVMTKAPDATADALARFAARLAPTGGA